MNLNLYWIFGLLFIGAENTFAQMPCEHLNSAKAVAECALSRHPAMLRQEASQKIGESLEKLARQRPNPEAEVQSFFGENQNETATNHQINLSHTFELGGKRSGRMNVAKAEALGISSQALHTKEEIYMNTTKTLYRIRQIHSEMKILDEALETFGKIQKQFKSRPRLGPEQEVSLSVFQLAQGDYQLRKNELLTEEQALETSIELAIGKPLPHNDSVLPPVKKQWSSIQDGGDYQGSEFRLAQAELKLSEARLNLAKGESWPNVKIGPSIQQNDDGFVSYWQYGFNISLPLPLYHTNKGERTIAALELDRANLNLEYKRKELDNEKKILTSQYQNAVQSLQQFGSSQEIEQRHRKIDQLYERGVVSSSLVIEAHRQMLDFTKNQHQQEIHAVEAWMKIRALEGKLFEGTL